MGTSSPLCPARGGTYHMSLTTLLLLLASQSTAGAARPRDARPVAKPSHLTSKQSPSTSFPAATSCVARAWLRSRKLCPSCVRAARGRWPRTTSGGSTSNNAWGGEQELLLSHVSVWVMQGRRPDEHRGEVSLCLQSSGGGLEHRAGAESDLEDNKSHSFFNKERVFIQN